MTSHEAKTLYEKLSIDGQQAVECGNFTEYLLSIDPETLAEKIAEQIATERDSWHDIQRAFAENNWHPLGMHVMTACSSLVGTYREQFDEITGWVRQWRDDAANRAHGLTEKGAFDEH